MKSNEMKQYKISIVVAFRNEEACLGTTLQSFVEQDYEDKEIILIDDESNDNSPEIAKKFTKKYKFIKYFRIKKKPGTWATEAFSVGVSKSNGDYILLTDANGKIEDTKYLSIGIKNFKKDKNLSGVVPFTIISDPQTFIGKYRALVYNAKYLDLKKINKLISEGRIRPHLFSKKAYNEVGGFDKNIKWSFDTVFAKKLIKNGKKIIYDINLKGEQDYVNEIIPLMKYQFKFGKLNWEQSQKIKSENKKRLFFGVFIILIPLSIIYPEYFLIPLFLHPTILLGNGIRIFLKNKDHKYRYYSFFSPIVSYIVNLPNLMGFLSEKIVSKIKRNIRKLQPKDYTGP